MVGLWSEVVVVELRLVFLMPNCARRPKRGGGVTRAPLRFSPVLQGTYRRVVVRRAAVREALVLGVGPCTVHVHCVFREHHWLGMIQRYAERTIEY